jgi:methylglutaconyl-CoA hydratase
MPSQNQPLVNYHLQDRIAFITLNNPEKRNALGANMVSALRKALGQAAEDTNAKVIILTGNGAAFCAGADLEALQNMQSATYTENLADSEHLKGLFTEMYTHPKVIIARINGHAIAGGCGLATLADFSIAVQDAKFAYTEVRIGFIPALVSAFLVRKIGEGKARELLLSGKMISAEQAQSYGLINRCVPADQLDEVCNKLAQDLCNGNSATAMAATKALLAEFSQLTLSESLHAASKANAHARATPDCKQGVAAFLNKESLVW